MHGAYGLQLPSFGIASFFKKHWRNGFLTVVVSGALFIQGVPGKIDRGIDKSIDRFIEATAPIRCATIPLYERRCNNENYIGGEAMPRDSCAELYNLRTLCER
jgi:hypothetical protein